MPVVQQKALGNTGPLFSCIKQPPEIGACAPSYRMARRQQDNHYHCRDVRRYLRLYFKPIQQFRHGRPRESKAYLHLAGQPHAGAHKSRAPALAALYYQQYESQYRTVPCRGHHRGISGGKERARIPYHLLQPGIQDGLAPHVHRNPVHYVHRSLHPHQFIGALVPKTLLNPKQEMYFLHISCIQ